MPRRLYAVFKRDEFGRWYRVSGCMKKKWADAWRKHLIRFKHQFPHRLRVKPCTAEDMAVMSKWKEV